MDMGHYEELFYQEASTILEHIALDIIALEKGDNSKLEELFRNIHTLKGMTASMGYKDMELLAHKTEDLLENVRSNTLLITPDFIDLMLQCSDMLKVLFDNIFGKKKTIKIDKTVKAIKNFTFKTSKTTKKSIPGKNLYTIKIKIGGSPDFKGVRAAVIYKELSERVKIILSIPAYDEMVNGDYENIVIFDVETELKPEKLKKFLSDILDVENVFIKTKKADVKSNEKTIEEKGREDKSYQNHTEEKQSELIYVRVKMSKLDELQNIVAELIITKSAFSEYFKTKDQTMLEDTTQKISRIISSLQDEVSNMRMVPLEEVFSRFPRFVRDSSKELNKKINFVIEGAQIEIDRALISGIYDPILHILKNSMDHGIESPERREKLGKNPAGLIKLTARREKNNVFIEIFDDGKGIDIEKIRTMIIEKGIFSKEIVGQMKEKDLINYIKKGGFSTADSITRFSGRGVGVDAVDKIVKKLGGKLIIESKFEHWTKVTIQLPLTLSIIKAMIVTCDERLFAIPLNNIQETVDVIANNIETIHNQEIVVLREEVYPLLRLHNIIGSEIKDKNDILQGIVIGDNISKDILIVNSYESQTEIVVKNLPPLFDNVNLFSGISILGTGNMALILDINNLI